TGVDRRNADTIGKLYVPSRSGLVRLDSVVKLHEGVTAFRIEGLDRQRQVGIRANVAPGYGLADRLVEMFKAAEKLNMPAAYTTMVVGRGRELERTFGEFLMAFALSIVFMYMILASQFESLVHPITILLSLPLAAGMAPLALGTGPGAEERRSIAIVVIGGQSLSLLLTLIVTPVAYSIFDDFGAWVTRRKGAAIPAAREVNV